MLRRLRNYLNRDKLRNAELQALLAESEKALETTTISRDYSLSEVARLHARVLTLSSQVVEAANRSIRFDEEAHKATVQADTWKKESVATKECSNRQSQTIKDHLDLIEQLRSSLSDYARVNNDLTSEGSKALSQMAKAEEKANTLERHYIVNQELLEQSEHRIALAVAALTRDLPSKTTSVEYETFSLN